MNQRNRPTSESQDGHILFLLGRKLSEIFLFMLELVSHPVSTVLSRLREPDDRKRIEEALFFFVAMLSLWFVFETPLFLWTGIKREALGGFVFFVVYLTIYFVNAILFALVLHLFLRVLCVRSDVKHTVPCYLYTSVLIPFYAVLVIPSDIVKEDVIAKAGTIEILLQPQYSQLQSEVLQQKGPTWETMSSVGEYLASFASIVVFLFLSWILSKWYWPKRSWSWMRYLRCLLATALTYLVIWISEALLAVPYHHLEALFRR